jgi:hypothetical protein
MLINDLTLNIPSPCRGLRSLSDVSLLSSNGGNWKQLLYFKYQNFASADKIYEARKDNGGICDGFAF